MKDNGFTRRLRSAVFQKRTLLEAGVLFITVLMLLFPVNKEEYRIYGRVTQRYLGGRVVEITSEELNDSFFVSGGKIGNQQLTVRLRDGREISVKNYITDAHSVKAAVGTEIIVCADEPGGDIEPYYSVYSYNRTVPVILLVAVFAALTVAVGRRKGVDAFLALFFSLIFILNVSLPLLYAGSSAVAVGLMTVLVSTSVTILMIHGASKQCLYAVVTTLAGELAACVVFLLFASLFKISGFQSGDAESLLIAAQHTGLDIYNLLLCGMMISSVGAVMDVSVSILSSLREVAQAMDKPSAAALFKSGISIGRDLIGTMANTLIFAFVGGSLGSMLVFYSYGIQTYQLLNSDYLAVELVTGICSTVAVILTVPAAAVIGALAFGGENK